jgi:hypothetical protein
MKKVVLAIGLIILVGCQNFVDDQSGINRKIEDFVRVKLYPKDTTESIDFSRFLRGQDKQPVYYWLDYKFSIKSNGQKKLLKYHFETDSLLNIIMYKDISSELK